jgi:putative FmdB family regulatory protein
VPIYEYRRPDGTTFEVVQSFSDEPLKTDPESGVPVERVLHPPAVHFKGKGFYNTDYGTRARQRETAAAAEGSSKSKDSDKGATESAAGKDAGSGKDSGSGKDASGSGKDASGSGKAKGSGGSSAAKPVRAGS